MPKDPLARKVCKEGRTTRQQEKYVFKTDTKIGKKCEKSPYYLGTKLWETQFADNVHEFKKIHNIMSTILEKYHALYEI